VLIVGGALIVAIATVAAMLVWMRLDPGAAGPEAQRRVADQIVSVFENNDPTIRYEYVQDLGDGRGYTAGRAGFCTGCGDLNALVARYTEQVPDNPLERFRPELARLAQQHSSDTSGLPGFEEAWRQAASDSRFRDLQDGLVDELYYGPAEALAQRTGVQTPLGIAIAYDTAVQHGMGTDPDGLPAIVERANTLAGGTPATGVPETEWLQSFLTVREEVLEDPANANTARVWRASVGRVHALQELLDEGNLDLEPPITINPFGTAHTLS
jgi:chitosanase